MARFAFFAVLAAATLARAESTKSSVDVFLWKANASFELKLTYNGGKSVFRGELKESGDSTETTSGNLTARLNSYPNFVTVIVTRVGEDTGQLYILERHNADFEQMNAEPILGRAAAMSRDLQYSLDRFNSLQKLDGKDPSFCFVTMVDYFRSHPDRTLDAFADGVEKGVDEVREVPKPTTRVSGGLPGTRRGQKSPPPLRHQEGAQQDVESDGTQNQQGSASSADPQDSAAVPHAPAQQKHRQRSNPYGQPVPDWAYRQQQKEYRRHQRQMEQQQQWGGWGRAPQRRSDAGGGFDLFGLFR